MKRRDFLRAFSLSGAGIWLAGCSSLRPLVPFYRSVNSSDHGHCGCSNPFEAPKPAAGAQDMGEVHAAAHPAQTLDEHTLSRLLHDERARSAFFAQDFPDDIFFTGRKLELVKSLTRKLRAVQNYVGHGNFNLVGMDDFFAYAELASGAGAVTEEEKRFLEEIFYFDANEYGFRGEKVAHGFTQNIRRSDVYKVPGSGHFLLKERSLALYERARQDVGESLVLTSGVRGIAKQFHLFFEKGLATGGNMSKASRSLAPPGYSFHFQGDFDVGKKNFGLRNFEESFARTDEFKRLVDLGYVNIRYTQNNSLGVRFEPWHLKV